jgi:hypothetical protein
VLGQYATGTSRSPVMARPLKASGRGSDPEVPTHHRGPYLAIWDVGPFVHPASSRSRQYTDTPPVRASGVRVLPHPAPDSRMRKCFTVEFHGAMAVHSRDGEKRQNGRRVQVLSGRNCIWLLALRSHPTEVLACHSSVC